METLYKLQKERNAKLLSMNSTLPLGMRSIHETPPGEEGESFLDSFKLDDAEDAAEEAPLFSPTFKPRSPEDEKEMQAGSLVSPSMTKAKTVKAVPQKNEVLGNFFENQFEVGHFTEFGR